MEQKNKLWTYSFEGSGGSVLGDTLRKSMTNLFVLVLLFIIQDCEL